MRIPAQHLAALSPLLEHGMELPEDARGVWLESLSEPFPGAKVLLAKMLAEDANGGGDPLLDTLPKLAADTAAGSGQRPGLQTGNRIGIYALVREIGQGGMATVWLARRTDELIQRPVALKLPHLHLQSARFAERFTRERDILANLTHPHIAHLYDAGISPEGQPFLAMEFVAGEPLTDYCTRNQVNLDQRLQLFLQVLAAVEYAHTQGVIHRDLKPSNILVRDGGQVVLLDFGIAKLIVTGQVEQTELTLHGGAVLTPHYASPEQIRGETLGPTTDVYSLGVLLYELLSGQRPYELTGSTRGALEQAILSTEPRRPSEVVTQKPRTGDSGSSPEPPSSRLRGDLDTIVLKALKKSPTERYPTASAFAEDLQRHLRHEAVSARPDTVTYRLRKLAHRHRSVLQVAALAGLAGAAMAIIAAVNGGWISNHRASALTPTAVPAKPADEIDPKSVAVLPFVDMSERKDQEYFTDGLSEELLDLLSRVPNVHVVARTSAFSFKGKSDDIPTIAKKLLVANVLEGSVRKSGNTLRITAQLVRADNGYHVWSQTYDRKIDDIFKIQDEIASEVTQALKVSLLDGAGPKAAVTKSNEAYALYLQARAMRHGVRTSAETQTIVKSLREASKLDPSFAPAWAELARALIYQYNIGDVPAASIDAEARNAADQALKLNANLAAGHLALGSIRHFLDWDWPGAEMEYRRALALEPRNSDALAFLGGLSMTLGRVREAESLMQRAVELDPLDERYYALLGDIDYFAGRLAEAEAHYRKSLDLHPGLPTTSASLGEVLLSRGNLPSALEMMQRESDESMRLRGLSIVYYALGRRTDADSALAELELKHANDVPVGIAEVHAYRGNTEQALSWLDRAYRQRDYDLLELKINPRFATLHADARYKVFLQKMRLPE